MPRSDPLAPWRLGGKSFFAERRQFLEVRPPMTRTRDDGCPKALTVKETWQVTGEGTQRLTIEGRGPLKGLVAGTIVYENSAKFFTEGGQPVHSQRLGDDWLEPLFHFRSSRWFRNRLVNLHVTSPETLKDRAPLASEGEPEYEAPNFIRLSRWRHAAQSTPKRLFWQNSRRRIVRP